MSYNIAIVIPQLSSDDTKAWAELDQLIENDHADDSAAPPEVFRKLHE